MSMRRKSTHAVEALAKAHTIVIFLFPPSKERMWAANPSDGNIRSEARVGIFQDFSAMK